MTSRVSFGRALWQAGVWIALALLASGPLQAACTKVQPGWLWNYDGAINEKYRIRMTLVFGAGEVTGVYFYASQLRDLRLAGRIEQGSRLLLDELDATGKVTGRIRYGRVVIEDGGQLSGDIECGGQAPARTATTSATTSATTVAKQPMALAA